MDKEPHYLDKNWHYQPSTSHNDASEFRKRMEQYSKLVKPQPQQPERNSTTDPK